jgi:hypothetical protein
MDAKAFVKRVAPIERLKTTFITGPANCAYTAERLARPFALTRWLYRATGALATRPLSASF